MEKWIKKKAKSKTEIVRETEQAYPYLVGFMKYVISNNHLILKTTDKKNCEMFLDGFRYYIINTNPRYYVDTIMGEGKSSELQRKIWSELITCLKNLRGERCRLGKGHFVEGLMINILMDGDSEGKIETISIMFDYGAFHDFYYYYLPVELHSREKRKMEKMKREQKKRLLR